ncbi:hypothetical protein [Nonomuraea turcica]|uniref:hypothetical protein n=1 Tax=Nonomuraea sp. G32 TaxID=3067274 RepID=UPI00273C7006|nr:hypothetical protein [Nonomuraea sp. G32]MDP4502649.1 hypothetical protein [Nonomuraea sp. G32]
MQFIETSIIGVQFAVLTFRRQARRLRSFSSPWCTSPNRLKRRDALLKLLAKVADSLRARGIEVPSRKQG